MKKARFALLAILGLSAFFTSCETISTKVYPSKDVTSDIEHISGYTGLNVSNAFTVYVTFSDVNEGIEIEANENLHEYIEVYKQGDDLVIKIQDNISIRGDATFKAYVRTQNIESFDVSGASSVTLENQLVDDEVSIELSGASFFSGAVNVAELNSDISGASVLDLGGRAGSCYFDASGASTIKDYSLQTNKVNIDLSGASNAFLTINEEIVIEASGASSLFFRGNAYIKSQNLSGASSVHQKN